MKNKTDMEQVGNFKLYSTEEVLDERFGPIGTPERDRFEADVAEAVHAYEVGEAIKKARQQQNLTQEQLGQRIGVKKAQISRLEHGRCMTLTTLSRVFRALGIPSGSLELGGGFGRVPLW